MTFRHPSPFFSYLKIRIEKKEPALHATLLGKLKKKKKKVSFSIFLKGDRFLFLKGLTLSLHYLVSKWSFKAWRWVDCNPGPALSTSVPTRSVSVLTVLQTFSWQKALNAVLSWAYTQHSLLTKPYSLHFLSKSKKLHLLDQAVLISHLPHIDFEDMVHKTVPLLLHSLDCDRLSLYQLSFVDTGGKYYPKVGKEEKRMYKGHLKCSLLNFPKTSTDSKAQISN